MQFSPVTSFLFGPNIHLNILFSNTLSLCSSSNVRDQVSRLYRTTGKNGYIPSSKVERRTLTKDFEGWGGGSNVMALHLLETPWSQYMVI
jgi:hypothetical protein